AGRRRCTTAVLGTLAVVLVFRADAVAALRLPLRVGERMEERPHRVDVLEYLLDVEELSARERRLGLTGHFIEHRAHRRVDDRSPHGRIAVGRAVLRPAEALAADRSAGLAG